MSSVLEKTLSGLVNSLLGPAGTKGTVSQGLVGVPGLKNVSLGLISFVEKLQAAKRISKQEEDHCLEHESKEWMKLLSSPGVCSSLVADILCRALIAHVHGYPLPSLHIHAIKLTQSSEVLYKKMGYLFVSQSLGPGSELTLLLVNTVQRDLTAPSVLQVAASIAALPVIITPDLTPAIITPLTHCLAHQQAYIRRRAAVMMGVMAKRCGEDLFSTAGDQIPHLLHLLTNHDPGVALSAIMSLAKVYKACGQQKLDLHDQVAKSASHMLTQAVNGALPRDYQVNALPAPFVQIQMMRVLQLLSDREWQPPKEVIEALDLVLGQPWGGKEVALYSVLLECVFTITTMPYHDALVTSALKVVLGFLKSSNVDLKYVGLKALASVFSVLEEALTPSHLEAVLDCLYHSDKNLQAKTLRLLCAMANTHNYQAVCSTLLEFCGRTEGQMTQKAILEELSSILAKYCRDVMWCVDFLSPLIIGSLIPEKSLTDTIVHVLEQGFNEGFNEENNIKSTTEASQELLLKIFSKEKLSLVYINLIASVLNLQYSRDPKQVSKYFTDLFLEKLLPESNLNEKDVSVFKCLKNIGLNDEMVRLDIISYLQTIITSNNFGLIFRELANDICLWLGYPNLSVQVIKNQENILCQKAQTDLTLSFLDNYVIEALEGGAIPFKPFSVSQNNSSFEEKANNGFHETYLSTSTVPSVASDDAQSSAPSTSTHLTASTSVNNAVLSRSMLACGKRMWSNEGRIQQKFEGEASVGSTADFSLKSVSQNGNPFPLNDDDENDDMTEGSVELADEAQEDKQKEQDTLSLQRSQLTQALLAGLGMTKSK
ncbi:AP-4 complex subunit epsilon-1-like [Penaeus chinensis]|uniref:AP-4 complex subunit epsilon-1-like n=1 Tax=Penaeus chinensis TaxID=139456 RepID=UPI001FB7077F|nr:AP-4 complex subunit epsilon-1-like [Penaeus chinensis]XP_047475698.1 AP-4 complex subunit epsilon-1-like [Penaeus chinensis]XP_047475699.1 AP-4 complex subunit epsilon-1-like [Penaeus chinensis]XP_047475700.1 AP-4 complex subunit epsilon-1-like [Penaeus chinensis]